MDANTAAPLSDVGNFYPFLKALQDQSDLPLSYLSKDWSDAEAWRTQARSKIKELLSYSPEPAPFEDKIIATAQDEGFTRHTLTFNIAPGRRAEAYLLIPDNLKEPAPAVLALHDHGGFYYYGKEKISRMANPPDVLKKHVAESYEGQYFADELARQGYVVFVPDCFYFGTQRLDPAQVSAPFTEGFKGKDPGSDEYILEFNAFASRHESLTAKTIFMAGSTWPGLMIQDDTASLSYLLSRPEVDKSRVACMGLSLGGFRSAHLFGLDPRIKTGVVAGWMCSYPPMLLDHFRNHTWMLYIPQQIKYMDLPDISSMNAPNPLLVLNCIQDSLFTMEGMKAADHKLASVYARMNAPEKFKCNYYDVPHCMNKQMQQDAFDWINHWLKEAR